MVAGHNNKDRVWIALCKNRRRETNRVQRVATHGLAQPIFIGQRRHGAHDLLLIGIRRAHQSALRWNNSLQARARDLQKTFAINKWKKLFGLRLATHGPKPRAAATSHDHCIAHM